MKTWLFYYCLGLTVFLTAGAIAGVQTSFIPLLIFLPISALFIGTLLRKVSPLSHYHWPFQDFFATMLLYYCFIAVIIMTAIGILDAKNISHLVSSVFFLPLTLYFVLQVLPQKRKSYLMSPKKVSEKDESLLMSPSHSDTTKLDFDRRQFLKMIGSVGVSLFVFSIFTKRARETFFGSAPSSANTMALKDVTGTQIDPAEKIPSDGYSISGIDDASSPFFLGFVNKDGDWYIMRDNDGEIKYYKKQSNDDTFTNEWSNKTNFHYPYFYYYF